MIETTINEIHKIVLAEQGLSELEYYKFYPIQRKIFIQGTEGETRIVSFVRKHGKRTIVRFDRGDDLVCIDIHQLIGLDGERRKVLDIRAGDEVLSNHGPIKVLQIESFGDDIDVFDITVEADDHIFQTSDGVLHHNTGKTQTVEQVLHDNGLVDGKGYFKITNSASPRGMYEMLYKYRDDVILFDDCDGALETQDGRNIIKSATDTKKVRKLAWGKKSSGMFDPDSPSELAKADAKANRAEAAEGEDELDDEIDERVPRYFNYTGQIIFISNLPLSKLDPDGALRTRAFIIAIDPTPDEIIERMGQILGSIQLENNLTLSLKERQKVLDVIKAGRRKSEASLRTLVRALNLAASGAPNWEKLVTLYA